jgi:hypothetical protein
VVTFFRDAITPACRQALAYLRQQDFIAGFYLAGGTALALQIGHRISPPKTTCRNEQLVL